jgi:hypothetical protein
MFSLKIAWSRRDPMFIAAAPPSDRAPVERHVSHPSSIRLRWSRNKLWQATL